MLEFKVLIQFFQQFLQLVVEEQLADNKMPASEMVVLAEVVEVLRSTCGPSTSSDCGNTPPTSPPQGQ
jgi:hypothetical protein